MNTVKSKLRALTSKKVISLLPSGNDAIKAALEYAKKQHYNTILIQDEGGWLTYKQIPKKLGLKTIELKTNHGIVDLDELAKHKDTVFLYNSMPGYHSLDDSESIYKLCIKNNILLINDISGSIGTKQVGDILIGSFGRWKPVWLHYGGFIASDQLVCTDNFDQSKMESLAKALDNLETRLNKLRTLVLKTEAELAEFEIIGGNGLVVIVKFNTDEEKEKIINYCEMNKYEYTLCPRYIRTMDQAVSIEIKRVV